PTYEPSGAKVTSEPPTYEPSGAKVTSEPPTYEPSGAKVASEPLTYDPSGAKVTWDIAVSGNADIAIKMAPRDNTLITITPVNIKNRIESFSGAERRFQPRDS
ncbi:hypothetical protein M2S68_27130, partial [Klebsiella pneumoniae]|nr:hypothetical protein [Klebsiella pneumoniae]